MASALTVRLGHRISELRRQRGWRQIDLAAHAELSKTHISDVERGKRELGVDALQRLAAALEVKASDLLASVGH